ncbi:MAG: ATP-binding protein [Deltaproteobacteria bacterium]|nr:ATP-binding protein [Kofleriaceae bacterium]
MATVHLVYGPVGAGKTTYGRALAAERGAVFFCLDEWMATLFLMDAPSPITLDWALPRTERCEAQIWAVARQVLARGIDVILELGFFTRDQRARLRDLVAAAGSPIEVHVLEVPQDVRRERVRARNRGSATLTVEVEDAMFDWAEGYYEPPAGDELAGARVIRA